MEATERNALGLALELIDENPNNPRAAITDDDVQDLAASMREQGLLQPVVVVPDGDRYRLRIGHRRVHAARMLGWTEIRAEVDEASDASQDLVVAVVENTQREGLGALNEGRACQQMLEENNGDVDLVAKRVGRSRRWVARRANLTTLAPEVITLLSDPPTARKVKSGPGWGGGTGQATLGERAQLWPAAWLEEIALLSKPDQVELIDLLQDEPCDTLEELRFLMRDQLRALSMAPWNLEDEKLVPAVGACISCDRHSAASPGLFDNPETEGIKGATCRDGRCFLGKLRAWRQARVEEAREKHGADLALIAKSPHQLEEGVDYEGKQRPGYFYSWSAAKKADKGARPVIVLDADTPKVRWMKPGGGGAPSGSSNGSEPGKPKTLRERRANMNRRRRVKAGDALHEFVVELTEADVFTADDWHAHGVQLALIFGLQYPAWSRDVDKLSALEGSAARQRLWEGMVGEIASSARSAMADGTKPDEPALDVLDGLVGTDWKEALAKSTADLPDPKSWANLKADGTPKAAPKSKAKRKAKASRKGKTTTEPVDAGEEPTQ